MTDRRYHKDVLDNGIRLITEEIPFVKSISLGIWVQVGSRDERESEAGLSHFLEHMLFKGTTRRSAEQIAQEIDSLGGELNAFTSRETTAFYTKVTDEYASRAVDLLSDIFRCSIFKPVEIEREKRVVLEEIKMVEDDPEDLIHDLHTTHVWRGHSISRPILGNVKTVRSISRRKILEYMKEKYCPERIVISAAGRFNRRVLFKQLNRLFGRFGRRSTRSASSEKLPEQRLNGKRVFTRLKKLEQAHICIGLPGLPVTHPDRYAAFALNTLLGGGMSSRLFQEIREKRGLVYAIYSQMAGFRDTGMLTIYAATSPSAVHKVVRLTLEELRRIREGGVRIEELRRAVNQMKGNIMFGLESTNNRMGRLARDEMYFGRVFTLEETMDEIAKISKKQIQRLSHQLLDTGNLSLTVLGRVPRNTSRLEKLLN